MDFGKHDIAPLYDFFKVSLIALLNGPVKQKFFLFWYENLVEQLPTTAGTLTYKRRLWPRVSSLIIEETLKKRMSK
jgi:hypothetical protein